METLSIISQKSWLTQEVTVDWKSANAMFICKKGEEEDTGNYRPVSLMSVPRKVMEPITLRGIMQYVQNWVQPLGVYERQILLGQPNLLG